MAIFDAEGMAKSLQEQLALKADTTPARELVEDFFKLSVAKLLETFILQYDVEQIDAEFGETMVAELISCFRRADLGDGQMSVEQYEKLYQKTMMEISQGASSENGVKMRTRDMDGYVQSDGGLYVHPSALR